MAKTPSIASKVTDKTEVCKTNRDAVQKVSSSSKRIVVKKIKMSRKRGGKRVLNMKSNSSSISGRSSNVLARVVPQKSTTTLSFGLPAFQYRTKSLQSDANAEIKNGDGSGVPREVNDSSSFFTNDDDDGQEEDIPSDTLMAINSLVQSDQGLHVPITNNGSVQVILESQIYSIFDEDHASSVNTELLELIHNNKMQRIYCHDMSTTAFIATEDYVKAVWDDHANQNHQSSAIVATISATSEFSVEVVSWFLSNLHHWTKIKISESNLEDRWEKDNIVDTDIDLKDVVLYLLNAQYLIRDPKTNLSNGGQEDSYFLWLPQWGIVLKTWNEARQQLLTLLAQRKEMSKANVLQKNRHSYISTNFLLNDLLYKERIRIVERPFGSFVQLVKDNS